MRPVPLHNAAHLGVDGCHAIPVSCAVVGHTGGQLRTERAAMKEFHAQQASNMRLLRSATPWQLSREADQPWNAIVRAWAGVLAVEDLQHRWAAMASSEKAPKPDALAVSASRDGVSVGWRVRVWM